MPFIDCEHCKKPVKMSPSLIKRLKNHFCNKKCRAAWRLEKKTKVPCDECGAILARSSSQLKRNKQHFCNQAHKGIWQSKNAIGEKHPRWAGGDINVTCAQCEKVLKRQRCAVDSRSERFFCNLECRGKWQSKNKRGEKHPRWTCTIIKCNYCNKEMARPRWWVERKQEYQFCNLGCMGNYASENFTGDVRYNWRGGNQNYYGPNWGIQRQKARKRDSYRCQYCSVAQKKVGRKLDVHHIKPFRDFNYVVGENKNYKLANTLVNLITLCSSCHKKAEYNTISIQAHLV